MTFRGTDPESYITALVYVVYLVICDSGQVTLRHLLVLCPSPFQPNNPESITQFRPRAGRLQIV